MTLLDKAEALLPCPFCGGEARYQADHTTECRDSVWCGTCDYGMFDPDEQGSVVAAWNRRALPARGAGEAGSVLVARIDQMFDEAGPLRDRYSVGSPDYIYWSGAREGLRNAYLAARDFFAALAPTDAAHVNETPKSEHDAGNVLTPAQAREAAARLLLDMLYMQNGAHEGVSKEDAQKMWDAASTREGYAAVDAFLRSLISERPHMTLARLIEAVEAGTFTRTDFSFGGWHPEVSYDDARRAFLGSLDAAKRLHDALLPGWAVELWAWADDDADARVYRTHTDKEPEETYSFWAEVDGYNPARAWLLAILRAMEGRG